MKKKINFKRLLIYGIIITVGFIIFGLATTASAEVETGWPAGQANIPKNPLDGFIDFEEGTEAAVISSTIPGVQFSTTYGINWRYGDIRTGNYNVYPYGTKAYETNGNFFGWLGVTGDTGRIDFTEGTATYLSVLTSTYSGLKLDAYDADNNFLATSGWATSNINTRTFTRLTVEAENIAYVLIHDTGNYWLIDDLCTDAPGVPAPIGDIAKETISGYMTSADRDGDGNPDFGWNRGYDISFEDEMLKIELNIQLIGDTPSDELRQQWEDGIEGIWSNQYDLEAYDGFYTYPIQVTVNWVTSGAHHVVIVHSGSGRDNMLNWYTESGWGSEYQDEIKAHEAGHMLGLYDEYLDDGVIDLKDGALDPDTLFTTSNSIMSDLGPPRDENYEQILEWLESKSGRDLSLAESPLPPYEQDDPIPDFNDLPSINVNVDIKPGSWPNPINIKNKGVIPVAICGTEDFDVTMIDPATIEITINGVDEGATPLQWNYEDVATPWTGEDGGGHDLEGDGYIDLSLKFFNQDVVNTLSLADYIGQTIRLEIKGYLKEEFGGTAIEGHDWVKINS